MQHETGPCPVDLNDPAVLQDIHRAYGLVRQHGPVSYDPALDAWCVSGHRQAVAALTDHDHLSRDLPSMPTAGIAPDALWELVVHGERTNTSFLNLDPPAHTPVRKAVDRGLSRWRVAAMERPVRQAAATLLEALPAGGEVLSGFAVPFALRAVLLGIGIDSAHEAQVGAWCARIATSRVATLAPAEQVEWARAQTGLQKLLRRHLEDRREAPAGDIVSLLADERDGLPLEDAIPALVSLLLGSRTVADQLVSTFWLLVTHPEVHEMVLADRSLIPNLVEEALRMESPVQRLVRVARDGCDIGGKEVPAHAVVLVLAAAANRDPSVFARPDALELHRPNAKRHISFGRGAHLCAGAAFARMQLRVALEETMSRWQHLRLRSGWSPRWRLREGFRVLDGLEMDWDQPDREPAALRPPGGGRGGRAATGDA